MAIASHASRLILGLCSLGCALALAQPTAAQTWSLSRERPSLFEIIAVDPVAEPRWPWGTEDVAGDGQGTTLDAEASVDLRSVYADARAGRLWLRAYVSATRATASTTAVTFFFIDSDQRVNSGGPASGQELWPALTKDPSRAGYELALGVRGDGTLLGVFSWDAAKQLWAAEKMPEKIALAERGTARDPLRLFGDDHAYAQVNLDLTVAKLDERCLANIFVRTWNDQTDKLAFGDWVNSFAMTCHARLNGYGDPEILKSNSCTSDDTCPAGGRCRDGICLFSYECNGAAACQADQRCTGGVCVHVREESCSSNAQCDGLVCQSAACVACSESGARACTGDAVCAPDGRCLSPSAAYGGDNDSSGNASGERVQGGAFSCSLTQAGHGLTCLWLALLPLAVRWTDRRSRRLRSERGGER
jgi:hypothetical protein